MRVRRSHCDSRLVRHTAQSVLLGIRAWAFLFIPHCAHRDQLLLIMPLRCAADQLDRHRCRATTHLRAVPWPRVVSKYCAPSCRFCRPVEPMGRTASAGHRSRCAQYTPPVCQSPAAALCAHAERAVATKQSAKTSQSHGTNRRVRFRPCKPEHCCRRVVLCCTSVLCRNIRCSVSPRACGSLQLRAHSLCTALRYAASLSCSSDRTLLQANAHYRSQ